jgi:hypothetical protein
MRSLFIFSILFLQFFSACRNADDPNTASPVTDSENEDDAARNFIRSLLDQDFNKARTYIVNDTLNNQYLDVTQRSLSNLPQNDRLNYKQASIQIAEKRMLNDSTAVIYYSNSYKKRPDSLKAVRMDGRWLIDLKYSLGGSNTVQ